MNKNIKNILKRNVLPVAMAATIVASAGGCASKKNESTNLDEGQTIEALIENDYIRVTTNVDENGIESYEVIDKTDNSVRYMTHEQYENYISTRVFSYNYENNEVIVDGEEYNELTTEKFEELTSQVIYKFTKNYTDVGEYDWENPESNQLIDEMGNVEFFRNYFGPLNLETADIIKFVAIANIDKLAIDNPALLSSIIGEQNTDEVMQSAYRVIGEMVMYNYNNYYATGSTEGFLRVSDAIFDPVQKQKVIAIEQRVDEIAIASQNDHEYMNVLIHSLLEDMLNPENELSYLDEGVGFTTLNVALEPVRGLFGMDLEGNSLLNETNNDLIKYFVSYVEDPEEYVDNALVTGYYLNVNDILRDCTKSDTYTRTLGE